MKRRFSSVVVQMTIMLSLWGAGAVPAAAHKPPPQLTLPAGAVVQVEPHANLERAIEMVADDTTILIADGNYRVNSHIDLRGKRNVTICSASRDPNKVVISGRGWDSQDDQDDILRIGDCENVTVAHLTFSDCHAYAVKVEAENRPRNIQLHNCHFLNIGTRGVKGSGGHGLAKGGSIRFCHFENTKIPPADWLFEGNYISAIDMMALDDWTISDNVFRSIKGRTGSGRAAVFVWVRSQRVTVERNLILDCDRGVAFGNPSVSTAQVEAGEFHVQDSICRNNFIVPGPDAGIELWWVDRVQVYHNTIWRHDTQGRGIRLGTRNQHLHVANNLVRGRIVEEDGEARRDVLVENNIVGDLEGFFESPAMGQLRLTSQAAPAIGTGRRLPDLVDDFFGAKRDTDPDIGAAEFMPRQ